MKKYTSPTLRARKVEPFIMCSASGNNGHHYGWDNPHNPHYQEEEEEP